MLAGSVLIEQQGYNDRLYYVLSGELAGFYADEEKTHSGIFCLSGAFIGVHSFSGTWTASSTVIAQTDVELAWI